MRSMRTLRIIVSCGVFKLMLFLLVGHFDIHLPFEYNVEFLAMLSEIEYNLAFPEVLILQLIAQESDIVVSHLPLFEEG